MMVKEQIIKYDNDLENMRKDLERSELQRHEIDREIKKIKKRSLGNAQGGWGTFSIVFEDNIKKHHPISLLHSGTQTSGSGMPMKKESRDYDSLSQKSDDIGGASRMGEEGKKTTPEQLSHFIEVGFGLQQSSFKHLDTYKETTFESKITKHLFELQDDLTNFKAVRLQNTLKSQLYENFALFNEINPIYISFNLGRNVSPFWDENTLSQEHFKLIKREAVYLAGEHYLTVNFLRCDDPYLVIRIIAFDNDSCTSYNFDLNYDDLMLFVDGNMRLLDPDNQHDLCQMLMNNMTRFNSRENLHDHDGGDDSGGDGDHTRSDNGDDTMEGGEAKYNRMITTGMRTMNQREPRPEITLAIEHKIYFNEIYRNEYERNKLIIAKNDKRKKGLLHDRSMNTDFDKSIVYEAFDILYTDLLPLSTHQANSVVSQISLGLLAGRMSGHKILKIAMETQHNKEADAKTVFMQDLCLYESDCTKQRLTQQTASIIVKIPEEHQLDRVLAVVVSFERLCNSDNFLIRVVEVQRYDDETMTKFQWDPMNSPPSNGSLRYTEHTVYLVKKNNGQFVRLTQYEVLNTEFRALLFRHSYGYSQSVVEFGGRLHSDALRLREPVEQHVNRLKKGARTEGMNFILRDFGIVRVKTMNNLVTESPRNDPIKEMIGGSQSRIQHEVDSDEDINMEQAMENEDEELFSLSNHYCTFSYYDDFKCLSRGEIYLRVHLDSPYYIDLTQKLSGIAAFMQVQPEEFGRLMAKSSPQEKAKILKQIFDQLIIVNSVNSETGQSRFRVVVDPKMSKMSDLIDRLKKERLRQMVDQRDMLENELDFRGLGITLNTLAECEKMTQVSIVNRKVFKITCYFVNNLKNLKVRVQKEKVFDWQLIYVEAESRFSTKSMVIAVTEDDIRQLLSALLERQVDNGKQVVKQESDILVARLSRSKKVIEFIMDALVIDEMHTGTLKLSITHLIARMQDRVLLSQNFKLTGGRYLPSPV